MPCIDSIRPKIYGAFFVICALALPGAAFADFAPITNDSPITAYMCTSGYCGSGVPFAPSPYLQTNSPELNDAAINSMIDGDPQEIRDFLNDVKTLAGPKGQALSKYSPEQRAAYAALLKNSLLSDKVLNDATTYVAIKRPDSLSKGEADQELSPLISELKTTPQNYAAVADGISTIQSRIEAINESADDSDDSDKDKAQYLQDVLHSRYVDAQGLMTTLPNVAPMTVPLMTDEHSAAGVKIRARLNTLMAAESTAGGLCATQANAPAGDCAAFREFIARARLNAIAADRLSSHGKDDAADKLLATLDQATSLAHALPGQIGTDPKTGTSNFERAMTGLPLIQLPDGALSTDPASAIGAHIRQGMGSLVGVHDELAQYCAAGKSSSNCGGFAQFEMFLQKYYDLHGLADQMAASGQTALYHTVIEHIDSSVQMVRGFVYGFTHEAATLAEGIAQAALDVDTFKDRLSYAVIHYKDTWNIIEKSVEGRYETLLNGTTEEKSAVVGQLTFDLMTILIAGPIEDLGAVATETGTSLIAGPAANGSLAIVKDLATNAVSVGAVRAASVAASTALKLSANASEGLSSLALIAPPLARDIILGSVELSGNAATVVSNLAPSTVSFLESFSGTSAPKVGGSIVSASVADELTGVEVAIQKGPEATAQLLKKAGSNLRATYMYLDRAKEILTAENPADGLRLEMKQDGSDKPLPIYRVSDPQTGREIFTLLGDPALTGHEFPGFKIQKAGLPIGAKLNLRGAAAEDAFSKQGIGIRIDLDKGSVPTMWYNVN